MRRERKVQERGMLMMIMIMIMMNDDDDDDDSDQTEQQRQEGRSTYGAKLGIERMLVIHPPHPARHTSDRTNNPIDHDTR